MKEEKTSPCRPTGTPMNVPGTNAAMTGLGKKLLTMTSRLRKEEFSGITTYMKDKASDTVDGDNRTAEGQRNDQAEPSGRRGDDVDVRIARNQVSESMNEGQTAGLVDTPDGDAWGENKVSTSIDE